jgi:3-hydroxyacyl-[acyl-carrier-protein] dehydratase
MIRVGCLKGGLWLLRNVSWVASKVTLVVAPDAIIRRLPMSETANASDVQPVAGQSTGAMDILQIQALLPHRYPFLLIDRVLEIQRKKKIVALKNVTINEPFFAGHFPGTPIMPGVLLVEAMAQAGATLLLTEIGSSENQLVVFTGIERARFRRPVIPGDQLRIEVNVLAWRRIAGRMEGTIFVGDKKVAEAVISCAVVDRNRTGTASQNPASP